MRATIRTARSRSWQEKSGTNDAGNATHLNQLYATLQRGELAPLGDPFDPSSRADGRGLEE